MSISTCVRRHLICVIAERLHDGASAHFSRAVRDVLNNPYHDRCIGTWGPTAWPPPCQIWILGIFTRGTPKNPCVCSSCWQRRGTSPSHCGCLSDYPQLPRHLWTASGHVLIWTSCFGMWNSCKKFTPYITFRNIPVFYHGGCLERDVSATHIPCDCEATVDLRFRHLSHYFIEPNDYQGGKILHLIQLLCFCTLSVVLFLFKTTHNISEMGFCLRLKVEHTQLGPIERDSPYSGPPETQ
jgi:hypothetical protein